MNALTGSQLLRSVQALAGDIGPRPAGHPQEAQARTLVERELRLSGIIDIEQICFPTADTWGYGTIAPILVGLMGNLFTSRSRLLGGAASLAAAYQFWQTLTGRMLDQPLYRFYPQRTGGTLLARIKPRNNVKHRITFSPLFKRSLRLSTTSLLASVLANAVASFLGTRTLRWLTAGYMGFGAAIMLADEVGPYVDGANDNASAVACALGIGRQATITPLDQTEIWLAFTGSEEVSHNGLNALLDRHGEELRDAWFIDFEMVGKGNIYYARRQAGLIYFTAYRPDDDSLALAEHIAAQ